MRPRVSDSCEVAAATAAAAGGSSTAGIFAY